MRIDASPMFIFIPFFSFGKGFILFSFLCRVYFYFYKNCHCVVKIADENLFHVYMNFDQNRNELLTTELK